MTCDDARELVALSALGATDAAETRLVDEHAAACAACAKELASMRRTASSLALAGAPAEPSASLRERVLARAGVARTAKSQRLQLAFPLAAAAMLVAALAVGALVLSGRERARDSRLVALLKDPDAWRVRIESASEKGRGVATAVKDPQSGEILVFAEALPPASAGRTHVLWLLPAAGAPVNARAARDGASAWTVPSAVAASVDVAGIAFSEEPSPDAASPTTVVAAGMR